MSVTVIEQIRRTVMYEGYALYPYRPSIKNYMRWTFGVLYPPSWGESVAGVEPSSMLTECLVTGQETCAIQAVVHFLQLRGDLGHPASEAEHGHDHQGRVELPPGMESGTRTAWHGTDERAVPLPEASVRDLLKGPLLVPFSIDDGSGPGPGEHSVSGRVELAARTIRPGVFCVTLSVTNTVSDPALGRASRDQALTRSMIATHALLRVRGGEFVSAMDPPPDLRPVPCKNVGCWPVLVGDPDDRSAMLAAPIILYDYPRLAPESPGDWFDATEMDEMLTLRLLTLADSELPSVFRSDPRTREVLSRAAGMSGAQILALHGVVRESRSAGPEGDPSHRDPRARLGGDLPRPGDRVRLRPRAGADAFDLLLAGRTATIVAIERDYENRVHFAVTVDDDPGAAEGRAGKIAHRFFFRPEEVEPIHTPDPRS